MIWYIGHMAKNITHTCLGSWHILSITISLPVFKAWRSGLRTYWARMPVMMVVRFSWPPARALQNAEKIFIIVLITNEVRTHYCILKLKGSGKNVGYLDKIQFIFQMTTLFFSLNYYITVCNYFQLSFTCNALKNLSFLDLIHSGCLAISPFLLATASWHKKTLAACTSST